MLDMRDVVQRLVERFDQRTFSPQQFIFDSNESGFAYFSAKLVINFKARAIHLANKSCAGSPLSPMSFQFRNDFNYKFC